MIVPIPVTGCPNLAICSFCNCGTRVTEDDTSYLLANVVPGFSYAIRVTHPAEAKLVNSDKPTAKQRHAKHLMKLQKKRF